MDKISGSDLDLPNAKLCRISAGKLAREVDVLKDQLVEAFEGLSGILLVLDKTLKSAKNAHKTLAVREKARESSTDQR